MLEINGFLIELFFKNGQMHIQIRTKKFDQAEALFSKIKEWLQK